jgi:fido (protein-threonine AMPylation protein)
MIAWQDRCPAWEYKDVPDYNTILEHRFVIIIRWIWALSLTEKFDLVLDTRTVHEKSFQALTPASYEHYAGHYRGESFKCLVDYEVSISSNPLVGHLPPTVPMEMEGFKDDLRAVASQLDFLWQVNNAFLSKASKIRRLAELVAALFNYFLEIHPYANGNGHMARVIVMSLFSRFGIFLRKWPLNQRPPDPPYSDLIRDYQNGRTEGFIVFLIRCI